MKPYQADKLPTEYKIDKELLRLLAESNERYGEYKSLLNTLEFDTKYFLDSVLLNESYKSTQIEGTQISQDEMYYLKYLEQTDDNLEIQNLKKAVEFAYEELQEQKKINLYFVNQMHRILLNSVRGSEKTPGQIRTTQNWIGPRGAGIDGAIFIPPEPEAVPELLGNLFEYMNDAFIDPLFVNVAISHAQFETIHAYKDGNGRLGRALIPVQMALLEEGKPVLFLSEIIELYKPAYQRSLMESRRGNVAGFIKFFLQCVIDQCNSYIYKINRIKEIYREDMKAIECFRGNSVYRIMPVIMRQIVFTKKEVQDESGVSVNVVSNIINQLVKMGIVVKDSSVIKKGYRYQRIYDVFVGRHDAY
ncbi:Fic family protein [Anaerobium acetethylicum]|uniref:Fic family protein n=1 Tax=Anaerobium acetethylicum TaxID=1619234 RepID=A0A1D3TSN8_9FIRM|nr:Fic family protein [Anaerobium acetethylicum]SCP96904.1 Fic family protein [Anaerobium acetethylicum]